MDINGAKALKKRLGQNGTGEVPAGSADVPEDAPPVFHWLGVDRATPDAPAAPDDPPSTRASLFRRLGLSFR